HHRVGGAVRGGHAHPAPLQFLVDVAVQAGRVHVQPAQAARRPQRAVEAFGVGQDLELGGAAGDVAGDESDFGVRGIQVARMAQPDLPRAGPQLRRQRAGLEFGTENAQRAGGAHCGLASSCWTMARHFSYSMWVKRSNCAGVPPTAIAPSRSISSLSLGSASLTPLLMAAMTSGGVFFGAK